MRSSAVIGVGVESFAHFIVRLVVLWTVCSGIGNPMCKATPMAKMRSETIKVSPRRKTS